MTTSSQHNPARFPGTKKISRYDDIRNGNPANGLVWGLENIDNEHPPTDEGFYSLNGRQFLRSFSWENKTRRRKDQARNWYTTAYDGDVLYTESEEGDCDVFTWKTPVGTVVQRLQQKHITDYPVKSLKDLEVWLYVQSHTHYSTDASWFESRDVRRITSISRSPRIQAYARLAHQGRAPGCRGCPPPVRAGGSGRRCCAWEARPSTCPASTRRRQREVDLRAGRRELCPAHREHRGKRRSGSYRCRQPLCRIGTAFLRRRVAGPA